MPGVTRSQPRELAYAEATANQSGVSAEADLTGLTITFVATARVVLLQAFVPFLTQATSTGIPSFKITDSSNAEYARWSPGTLAAGFGPGATFQRRVAFLTPGTTYTFKLRALTTAGTLTLQANANYPAFIRAVEV